MPLRYQDLNQDQLVAVAQTITDRLAILDEDEGIYPITSGTIHASRSGAEWACFSENHLLPTAIWFRVRDCPPDDGYSGFGVVLDTQGRPLGCGGYDHGLLVLHMVRGHWLAQVINTGWNLGKEIVWENTPDETLSASSQTCFTDPRPGPKENSHRARTDERRPARRYHPNP